MTEEIRKNDSIFDEPKLSEGRTEVRKRLSALNDGDDANIGTADLAGAKQTTRIAEDPRIGTESGTRKHGGEVATDRISRTAAATATVMEKETGPLFSSNEANELRSHWDAIQVGFVDEPRSAVEKADNLVAGTMKRLAEIFADERRKLEGQWDQGENVSTEDLRLALRRYRSFFSRLLSV